MSRFGNRVGMSKFLLFLLSFLVLFPLSVRAQPPVVYGIFFYSPSCPHCHDVMTNHWPGIQQEFGDQLQVLFVDVTTSAGSYWMQAARQAMGIASNGVPMLIIGSDVMVGALDIPMRAPTLIRAGLDAGGVGYPPIPQIETVFQSALPAESAVSAGLPSGPLLDDPANLAALLVLLGLVASIGIIAVAGWSLFTQRNRQHIARLNGVFGRRMAFLGALVGIVLAASLVIGSLGDLPMLVLSVSLLAAFLLIAFAIFRATTLDQLSNWVIPLVLLVGLLVAGYLAFIEITSSEAICGVAGDCNAVQQSAYARILGVPVGVIGVIAYLGLLSLWLVSRVKTHRRINAALFLLACFGVVFSVYLTFLEPFVIGTSCAWCLTSAVTFGILLWLTAPAGWDALYAVRASALRQQKAH